jgi:dTDP-4-dehydrorhamnose reductase
MTTILLIGRNGQVGWELQRSLAPLGQVIALGREGMDLSHPDSIRQAIRDANPAIIVNAAGYTAVDKAETEADLAVRINGLAPGIMAEEAARIGALFVHYSTDYVFDGAKNAPYLENDATNPLSSYGRSKLAGEAAVRASGARHLIFRTSWVYSARGNNFVRLLLRLARERNELRIVNDQVGAPTWARSIADLTGRILEVYCDNPGRREEFGGLYHLTARGAVSRFDFAEAIFARAKSMNARFKAPKLIPIPASDYPLPARRPANSRLSTAKLATAFGVAPPRWDVALRQCLEEMGNGQLEMGNNS